MCVAAVAAGREDGREGAASIHLAPEPPRRQRQRPPALSIRRAARPVMAIHAVAAGGRLGEDEVCRGAYRLPHLRDRRVHHLHPLRSVPHR